MYSAKNGRLNRESSWRAQTNDNKQWIQVDLGRAEVVTGISSQGNKKSEEWVELYFVSYSLDGIYFKNYTNSTADKVTYTTKCTGKGFSFNHIGRFLSALRTTFFSVDLSSFKKIQNSGHHDVFRRAINFVIANWTEYSSINSFSINTLSRNCERNLQVAIHTLQAKSLRRHWEFH